MASLIRPTYTDKKTGQQRKTRKWYAQFRDIDGKVRRVPLSPNRAAAQAMLNDLVRRAELGKAGIVDPHAAHRAVSLADHLAAYKLTFAAKGHTERQAHYAHARCTALFEGCGFAHLVDLSAEAAELWLAGRRKLPKRGGGFGPQTSNHYAAAVKAFGTWCVRTKRLPANPFAHLAKVNVQVDIRHQRREPTADELAALVAAARAGRTHRHLAGPDRAVLYHVAAYTGLRAAELASLTPPSFALDATPPTVTVEAAYSKHRRHDVVPLHPQLVDVLRPWLATRPADAPLWPGKWAKNFEAVDLIRRDLRNARAAWLGQATSPADRAERERSDFLTYRDRTGRVADFHALRHTFVTNLVKAGVLPKDAKELARHSTIILTMDKYAYASLSDTAAAVAKLAGPTAACTPACTKLALPADGTGWKLMAADGAGRGSRGAQPLRFQVVQRYLPGNRAI